MCLFIYVHKEEREDKKQPIVEKIEEVDDEEAAKQVERGCCIFF